MRHASKFVVAQKRDMKKKALVREMMKFPNTGNDRNKLISDPNKVLLWKKIHRIIKKSKN